MSAKPNVISEHSSISSVPSRVANNHWLPRAKLLKKTGVGSVAMISAITKVDDYKRVCRKLLPLWPEANKSESAGNQTMQSIGM